METETRLIKQVSINFCGGCNPLIDRLKISREIIRLLSAQGVKVIFNSFESDLIIYLSGCSSNCAQKSGADRGQADKFPCVVVAAASVDAIAVAEDKIASEIAAKIKESGLLPGGSFS